MAKVKNRDKRKKARIKKSNQEKQAKYEAGDFVHEFKGYTQISFKKETDDDAIKAGVIKVGDWRDKGFQIFKHDRYFLVKVYIVKFDRSIKPAELEWVTKDKLYRTDIVEVARQMAEEMTEGHDGIDYDNSWIRISA